MGGVGRHGLPLGQDARAPFQPGHQAPQLLGHGQHHPRATGGGQRHIAGELDAVAEALLGMDQEGLTVERPAVPEKVPTRNPGDRPLEPPPLLVQPEPLLDGAGAQQGHGQIVADARVLRGERMGGAEMRERLVRAARLHQADGQVGVGRPVPGRHGGGEQVGRTGIVAAQMMEQAEPVQDAGMVRRLPQQGAAGLDRLGEPAGLEGGLHVGEAVFHMRHGRRPTGSRRGVPVPPRACRREPA